MMGRILTAAAAALVAAGVAGCCSHGASTGWRFEIGKPAEVYTSGLVQQNPGPLSMTPLGSTIPPMLTGTAAQAGAVQLMPYLPPPQQLPAPRLAAPPAAQDCTCEQILAALQRLEVGMRSLAPSRAAPLPKGPELEE